MEKIRKKNIEVDIAVISKPSLTSCATENDIISCVTIKVQTCANKRQFLYRFNLGNNCDIRLLFKCASFINNFDGSSLVQLQEFGVLFMSSHIIQSV